MRRPIRSGRRLSLLLGVACTLAVGAASGCGDDEIASLAGASEETPAEVARAAAEAFADEPSVPGLLGLLGRRHQDVRGALGPHSLQTKAEFSLEPEDPRGRPPRVGESLETRFALADHLTLKWAGPDRFDLRQSNDQGERRELVMERKLVYTRLREETWWRRDADGEVHELWLDDAIRSAHDVIQLAAPRLGIAVEATTLEGRDALRVTLSTSGETHPEWGARGARALWREDARVDEVRGNVHIDAATGTWLALDVSVRYRFADVDGGTMLGSVTVQGSLTPGAVEVLAPKNWQPAAERWRPELERRELLSGLAGP